ncbi:MAG: hypothetical protein KDJ83_10515 [Rhodobacteraceae bacterium]|nr:hypothetical protein [Paracoccaceae bacterium]
MSRDRGVLLIATGAAHVAAARAVAESVHRTNPGLSVGLFSDSDAPGGAFDWTGPISAPHVRSKVDYLGESPFDETLYLDTDTRVFADLSDLFRLLERFDLAAAHRDRAVVRRKMPRWRKDVPASFPEHNGGVLLYRGTPAVRAFLADWRAAYAEAGLTADQRTFRELLWDSDLRIAVLPQRYNRRRFTWLDWLAEGRQMPAILHTNRLHPGKQGGWIRQRANRLIGPGV